MMRSAFGKIALAVVRGLNEGRETVSSSLKRRLKYLVMG